MCKVKKILFLDCSVFWITYSAAFPQIKSLKVADIIRGGLRRFSDSLGQLWNSLADFFIRSGHFEKVRPLIFETVNKGVEERRPLKLVIFNELTDNLINKCWFLFPQARDVYEEAIQTVMTVRDFGQVLLNITDWIVDTDSQINWLITCFYKLCIAWDWGSDGWTDLLLLLYFVGVWCLCTIWGKHDQC